MVFSVGSADMSHIGTLAPLVKEKLMALGSSRVTSSLILTGELAGAGIAAESANHDLALNKQLNELVWGVASNHGVNGMRSLRAVAAGEQTGSYLNIFYTDSVDGYLAASAELSQNAEFVGFMTDNGGRITNRSINRSMG